MKTAEFTRMEDATREEYEFLDKMEEQYVAGLPDRVMEGLRKLAHSISGYRINRLEHSPQGAVDFCHQYDQNCFDPEYDSEPLEFFEPVLRRVLSNPRVDDPEQVARYGKAI